MQDMLEGIVMQPEDMKAARKSLGWTQQQLADALGMSRKAIVEMEGGKAPIEKRTELAARWITKSNSARVIELLVEAVRATPPEQIPEIREMLGRLIEEERDRGD